MYCGRKCLLLAQSPKRKRTKCVTCGGELGRAYKYCCPECKKAAAPKCKEIGCDRPAIAFDLCHTHRRRFLGENSLPMNAPITEYFCGPLKPKPMPQCVMCGTTMPGQNANTKYCSESCRLDSYPKCIVPGCDRRARSRLGGLCQTHLNRAKGKGKSPLLAPIQPFYGNRHVGVIQ